MSRAQLFLAVLLAAVSAHSQTVVSVDTLPDQPVANTPFVIRVTTGDCAQFVSSSIDQVFITIRVAPATGCTSGGTLIPVNIGPVPAGNYSVQVVNGAGHSSGFSPVVVNGVAGVVFPIRLLVGCLPEPPLSISNPSINGTNIDFHVTFMPNGGCVSTAVPTEFDPLVGPLPPGTYTVRLFREGSTTPFSTQTLQIVAQAPALDPRVLAVLAVALTVLALVRLRP